MKINSFKFINFIFSMQKNNDKETLIKIILVGDAGSGKTSIITRYVDDEFHPNALVVSHKKFPKNYHHLKY